MAIDFSALVYLPNFEFWARPIVVNNATGLRGIYDTRTIDIVGLDGVSIVSDQQTVLDIRAREFTSQGYSLPRQGDLITIPADGDLEALGDFEVVSSWDNGGGETTLIIRAYEPPTP